MIHIEVMKAFDSIKMGHRCRGWLVHSDDNVLPERVLSRGVSVGGRQWIVNASGARLPEVLELSKVVLDGGPRWVMSTAFGFVTGGVLWTVVYAALFALSNYFMYCALADAPGGSDTESADDSGGIVAEFSGVVAYMILAAAISLASVPGPWLLSDWTGLVSGLLVEAFLCGCVIVSAGIVYRFLGLYLEETSGLVQWADVVRWSIPALVWRAAAEHRETATQAVKVKLSCLWCVHPMGNNAGEFKDVEVYRLWNQWAEAVQACAMRVGGYGMLGFSASDLKLLSGESPTSDAAREIRQLSLGLSDDCSIVEPWVNPSVAFLEGYDWRLRVTEPENVGVTIQMYEIQSLISSLINGVVPSKVLQYRQKIERHFVEEFRVKFQPNNADKNWFFAGALMADSDSQLRTGSNTASVLAHGSYGCRFAVSISLLARGTDPVARLACHADMKLPTSGVRRLLQAIVDSTEALVSDLAFAAGVHVDQVVFGKRGLAFVDCEENGTKKSMSYSPDELAAASHLEETIMIHSNTFSPGSDMFENVWQGSEGVEIKVDVSDMVRLAPSAEAGRSACLGWMCHLGFTLAMLAIFMIDASKAVLILVHVAIPAKDLRVSDHMDNHFYMIYLSYILNYARFVSRWTSLAIRGRASKAKATTLRDIVFLFVNVVPVAACYVFKGWNWWVAFLPCILANIPGLLNTFWYGWVSAFDLEWWPWHVPNRWFKGRGYLEVASLRNRIGRNVLVFQASESVRRFEHVKPVDGMIDSPVRFVVVGGGTWRTL